MKKISNKPSPTPAKHDNSLRKDEAFKTLAVEEFSRNIDTQAPPESSDSAVAEARAWVEYDKL